MWDINAHALEFRVVILVLTTCLTNFAFQSLGNWVRRAFRTTDQFAKHFYRDHHGESTLEDVQATVRWKQRIMIAVLTTSAAAVSLSRAVISSPREEWISRTVIVPLREEWLHCSILLFLFIQSVALLPESRCTVRYYLALQLSLSCVLGLISLASEINASYPSHLENLQRWLIGAECFCHLATATLCLLLPRRPNVYHNNIMVDREFSTSILSRITFSWASKVICLSHQEKELEPHAIPESPRIVFRGQSRNHEGNATRLYNAGTDVEDTSAIQSCISYLDSGAVLAPGAAFLHAAYGIVASPASLRVRFA
ncbi:unnamed protein product [Penicillium manginii]